jgi:hypothetical protein
MIIGLSIDNEEMFIMKQQVQEELILKHLYHLDGLFLSNLVGGKNQKGTKNYV